MILDSFLLLLPILILVGGGYLLSRFHDLSQDTLVKAITDFLMPLLIFQSLYSGDTNPGLILKLTGATTFVVLLLFAASWIYAKIAGIGIGSFTPSITFMNSGFLGIPLMKLWGGLAAMNLIVIYDQIQTIYIFTLGIAVITGGFGFRSLKEIAKSPIPWAIFLGFAFKFLSIPVPKPLLDAMEFGGNTAPPLAAFTLGAALGEMRFRFNRHLIVALFLRFIGGFLFGWAASILFALDELGQTVVIVASCLPSAVFTSVLPLRYGAEADFSGTMVVVTTIMGIVTIPLSIYLAGIL